MNRELRIAKASGAHGTGVMIPVNRQLGLFEIGRIEPPRYSNVWRMYRPNSHEVGFAYSDTPLSYAGVNAGADGHLVGGWYWFSDD
jgi:hypothetical protein